MSDYKDTNRYCYKALVSTSPKEKIALIEKAIDSRPRNPQLPKLDDSLFSALTQARKALTRRQKDSTKMANAALRAAGGVVRELAGLNVENPLA